MLRENNHQQGYQDGDSAASRATIIAQSHSALHEYASAKDGVFDVQVLGRECGEGAEVITCRVQSLKWQGVVWQHLLQIIRPGVERHPGKAVLLIAGGSEPSEMLGVRRRQCGGWIAQYANKLGMTVAVLKHVPNQPLFGDLREDALVIGSFQKFIAGGGEDISLPLLMPMTKACMRGMDAVDQICTQLYGETKNQFIVSGVSKRGWTAYLAAAADPRVVGIVPASIDFLNLQPQMHQQLATFGKYSDMIQFYIDCGVLQQQPRAACAKLWSMIDPYTYRGLLGIPKLLVLGTNDPLWTTDAANLYAPGLEGQTLLHYVPNGKHRLGYSAMSSMVSFAQLVFSSRELPGMQWTLEGDKLGLIFSHRVKQLKLFTAKSEARDLREARWTSQTMPCADGWHAVVNLPSVRFGYRGAFVQALFQPERAHQMCISSRMFIEPTSFPFEVSYQGAAAETANHPASQTSHHNKPPKHAASKSKRK